MRTYNAAEEPSGSMDKACIRRIDLTQARGEDARQLLRREWLATNGLGGYASGTIAGTVTWRYHGLLIAALPAPFGRMVMLNHLSEYIRFPDGRLLQIGGEEPSRPEEALHAGHYVTEFRLENGLPIWRYEVEGIVLEKHVLFLYGQNTVHINYRLLSEQENVRLELRPSMHFRGHEHAVDEGSLDGYQFCVTGDRYEVGVKDSLPRLRLVLKGDHAAFTYDGGSPARDLLPEGGGAWLSIPRPALEPGLLPGEPAPAPRRHADCLHRIVDTMLALTPEEAVGFYHDRHRRL